MLVAVLYVTCASTRRCRTWLTSERYSDLDIAQLACGHNCCMSSVRGRICRELKVMINAMVVCLRGVSHLGVLFVYSGGNGLMERISSRRG